MKASINFLLTLAVFTFGLLSSSSPAHANEGFYVKALAGLNLATDEDLEVDDRSLFTAGEASFDAGSVFGLAIGYKLTPSWGVELDYQYRNNDIDEIANELGSFSNGGELSSTAIMANILYYPINTAVLDVYVGAGLGFLKDLEAEITLLNARDLGTLEDSSAAWQLILGSQFPLGGGGLSLQVEGRFLSGPGPEISNELGAFDLDYNNLSGILALSYDF